MSNTTLAEKTIDLVTEITKADDALEAAVRHGSLEDIAIAHTQFRRKLNMFLDMQLTIQRRALTRIREANATILGVEAGD